MNNSVLRKQWRQRQYKLNFVVSYNKIKVQNQMKSFNKVKTKVLHDYLQCHFEYKFLYSKLKGNKSETSNFP